MESIGFLYLLYTPFVYYYYYSLCVNTYEMYILLPRLCNGVAPIDGFQLLCRLRWMPVHPSVSALKQHLQF